MASGLIRTSVRSTAMTAASLRAPFAPWRRESLSLAERLDRGGLDRRLAERADLPERLERLLAVAAGLAQPRRTDRADEERLVDLGPADRAVQVAPREPLLHRPDLELALAPVLEVLGRPEEHVHEGAEERRDEAEHDGHPDQPRVLDPPSRVLVDPERGREPEDDDEEDRQVADDDPRAVAEEVEDSVIGYQHVRLLREGAFRRGSRRRTRDRRSPERRRPRLRRRSGARRTVPWYVLESDGEIGQQVQRTGDENGSVAARQLARAGECVARVGKRLDRVEMGPRAARELVRGKRAGAVGGGRNKDVSRPGEALQHRIRVLVGENRGDDDVVPPRQALEQPLHARGVVRPCEDVLADVLEAAREVGLDVTLERPREDRLRRSAPHVPDVHHPSCPSRARG